MPEMHEAMESARAAVDEFAEAMRTLHVSYNGAVVGTLTGLSFSFDTISGEWRDTIAPLEDLQ